MDGLEHFDHVDESRMSERDLQHANLLQYVLSTVLALPSLAQELGRVVQPARLVLTSLHHGKLPSVNTTTIIALV